MADDKLTTFVFAFVENCPNESTSIVQCTSDNNSLLLRYCRYKYQQKYNIIKIKINTEKYFEKFLMLLILLTTGFTAILLFRKKPSTILCISAALAVERGLSARLSIHNNPVLYQNGIPYGRNFFFHP